MGETRAYHASCACRTPPTSEQLPSPRAWSMPQDPAAVRLSSRETGTCNKVRSIHRAAHTACTRMSRGAACNSTPQEYPSLWRSPCHTPPRIRAAGPAQAHEGGDAHLVQIARFQHRVDSVVTRCWCEARPPLIDRPGSHGDRSVFSILQLALDCVMTVLTVIYDTSSMETIMDMPYM
jgi:hypothetical protein